MPSTNKKRIQTVDNWADKDIDSRIIKNDPSAGFVLEDVVSRYSTSNKLYRVLDPRGFELEISAENLLDLILKATISKGRIVDDCVWLYGNNGKPYLVTKDDSVYKDVVSLSKAKPATQAEEKYYRSAKNGSEIYRYEGAFFLLYMSFDLSSDDVVIEEDKNSRHYYDRHYIKFTEVDIKQSINLEKGKVHVYTSYYEYQGKWMTRIEVRKSKYKDFIEVNELPDGFDGGKKFNPLQYAKAYKPEKMYMSFGGHARFFLPTFFKTKKEALAYEGYNGMKVDLSDLSYLGQAPNVKYDKKKYAVRSYYSNVPKRYSSDLKVNHTTVDSRV